VLEILSIHLDDLNVSFYLSIKFISKHSDHFGAASQEAKRRCQCSPRRGRSGVQALGETVAAAVVQVSGGLKPTVMVYRSIIHGSMSLFYYFFGNTPPPVSLEQPFFSTQVSQ
jgi:hypothetical protein